MVKIQEIDTSNLKISVIGKKSYDGFEKYGVAMNVDHLQSSVTVDDANQGSALKLVKVAPCSNEYERAPSGHPATTNWNIFRSCVIPEKWSVDNEGHKVYNLTVLEKHPYTTQTFVPMGRGSDEDAFIVNVAPEKDGLPDFEKVESYIFKGDTAVTYNVNTWHSPMVVVEKTTDFCVVTNENDVPKENCVEVFYNPGINVLI